MSQRRTVALDVFDDFWEGVEFVDSEPDRQEAERRVPVTVVAATTSTLRHDAETGAISDEILVEMFGRIVRQLNDFLSMLGFCVGNPEIGTVRRTELPSHVPAILDFRPPRGSKRQLELTTLELHGFPIWAAPTDEDALYAVDLAFRDRLAEWRFRLVG
jgi:hypothetical protein